MALAKVRRQKRKKPSKVIAITKIIFILVIIWFLGNSLLNYFISFFVNTQIAQLETIEKKYETTGYILRDEIVINGPATGTVQNSLPPGERVSKDALLFEIMASSGTALQAGEPIQVKAPTTGVVSYITDGLEDFFQPNELQTLNMQKIEKLKAEIVDNTKSDVVEKGKRFCKIVNNLRGTQIYLEFPIDIFAEPLRKEEILNLRFPNIEKEVVVPIVDLKGIGKMAQVLVELPETWYSLINLREIPVEIILDKHEGILIPKKSLISKDNDQLGVYCLRKGFVFWQSVKIITEQEDTVMIEGLDPLTEIILNPKLVKEGQYLY